MKQTLYYTYLGDNGGTLTTPVHIPDAYSVTKCLLIADEGKLLTKDGVHFYNSVMVAEAETNKWYEIVGQD